MSQLFNTIPAPKIQRSAFNLSHEYGTAFDMGQIIPCLALEAVPGDIFNINSSMLVRMQPMVAPAFAEINATFHTFFVPYRILDEHWEDFITKGVTGENSYVLPRWEPTENGVRSLWDYFGFPIGVNCKGVEPIDYIRRAYNMIYNEYYRDENLQEEVALDNESIHIRAWEKDYFTSAFETPQRGTAPSFPISGIVSADFNDSIMDAPFSTPVGNVEMRQKQLGSAGRDVGLGIRNGDSNDEGNLKRSLNYNKIDLSDAVTFDLEDFRYVACIQRAMERSMRGGVRYTSFLRNVYGTSPRDERLDRPEYIGGSKVPIVISEVLQTSETTNKSPQGNLAGHGITYSEGGNGNYRATEFGIILSFISILPRASYHQGMNKQWMRKTAYDFFNPAFVNLGEQEILQSELYATNNATENETIFGFQGRYNELRYMPSKVTSHLRPGQNLEQYTLTRDFDSAPGLNEAFIQCKPGKRIFAVHLDDEPSMIVRIQHHIKAIRPLPIQPVPGISRI